MFHTLSIQDNQDLIRVCKDNGIIDINVELVLADLMGDIARCTSTAWDNETKCLPCNETIVITSKYPKLLESARVALNDLKDGRGGVHSEGMDSRPSKSFTNSKKPTSATGSILDTLVLNLVSKESCSC